MKPIREIAALLGIAEDDLVLYGPYKAKVPLKYIDPDRLAKNRLILVSAISPTPAGEGKTTVTIGLTQGMNRIGKRTAAVLREPSLGPVFGIKGGATGSGRAQVVPMEDINLHFTGDFAAVEKAHNLLSALIDNNIQNKKFALGIDPRTVRWKRVMDMNDRSLRKIIVGLGGTLSGVPRETGFDITAASEVMAVLCLAENLMDLKRRLGNIFVGFTHDRAPVFARDLKAAGAMTALLRDAVLPNLVQTIEGHPALIHGGPFANIAQGTNSVLATKMALSLSDYAVTEAGFAFDLGAEKFFDIKCGYSGLSPRAVVLVATLKALKYHGGVELASVNRPDPGALGRGMGNLEKHLENIRAFGVPAVVAVNRFAADTDAEIAIVKERCRALGVEASVADVWGRGGEGAEELAEMVCGAADRCSGRYKPTYDWSWDIPRKIETIARNIYGAKGVDYSSKAREDLESVRRLGLEGLPVCMAKTQSSLSDDPKLLGRPENFNIRVREIEIAAGAGFVIPILGDIMRMPGLPVVPAAEAIDVDENGTITGLF
jgi:formate--tetrahydrofolate ligase